MRFIQLLVALLAFSFLSISCAEPLPIEDVDAGPEIPDVAADADTNDTDEAGDADPAGDTDDPDTSTDIEPWDCDPELSLDAPDYVHLDSVPDEELLDALFPLVANHLVSGYNLSRNFLFNQLEVQDDGMLECVYTGRRVLPDGTRTPDGFNTEHTWPQSRGAGVEPTRSDLHHLYPCDAIANDVRANYEFGEVSCTATTCPWAEGGSLLGPSATDSRNPVFEVRPERRGDVARAIFYVALRYEFPLSTEEEATLRGWNCEDPPDLWERTRNDAIGAVQGKNNPFIDRPDLIDRIPTF